MEKLKPLEKRSLTFVTTNNCNAACEHCLMCCKPGGKHTLTFEQMKKAIDEADQAYDLLQVVFTGGEPTLLGKDLLLTIAYCSSKGIMTRMVTNAMWADTPEHAEDCIKLFRAAGLCEINFSYDDYHAAFIPEQNIINAWKASKNKGFAGVLIANAQSATSTIDAAYIKKMLDEDVLTWDMDQRYERKERGHRFSEDGTEYIITESRLQCTGRAKERLAAEHYLDFCTDEELQTATCNGVVTRATVSFDNHLWACCGVQSSGNSILDLGDLNVESITDVAERAADSIILNAIHEVGPYRMMMYAKYKDPSIVWKEKYFSMCEMCNDMTTNPKAVKVLKENVLDLFNMISYMRKLNREAAEAEAQ